MSCELDFAADVHVPDQVRIVCIQDACKAESSAPLNVWQATGCISKLCKLSAMHRSHLGSSAQAARRGLSGAAAAACFPVLVGPEIVQCKAGSSFNTIQHKSSECSLLPTLGSCIAHKRGRGQSKKIPRRAPRMG